MQGTPGCPPCCYGPMDVPPSLSQSFMLGLPLPFPGAHKTRVLVQGLTGHSTPKPTDAAEPATSSMPLKGLGPRISATGTRSGGLSEPLPARWASRILLLRSPVATVTVQTTPTPPPETEATGSHTQLEMHSGILASGSECHTSSANCPGREDLLPHLAPDQPGLVPVCGWREARFRTALAAELHLAKPKSF